MKHLHIKNHITSYKKIYHLLIISLVFQIFFIINLYSKEQVGLITDQKGFIYKTNIDGEQIKLNLYDSIFTDDEIFSESNGTATILFNDNTSMLLQKSSSFIVNEFLLSDTKVNLFNLIINKGGAIIESGNIAKMDNGSMKIETENLTLGVRGTRFNIKSELNGSSTVSLAIDSFGKVGSLNVSSEGNLKTLFDPTQVLSAEQGNEIIERPATDSETKELEDATEEFIQSSKIDENIIQKNLEDQLIQGNLQDANNDGKVDVSDINILKQTIKSNKQEKIAFITENSNEDNVTFLSNVLNASDDGSIGESINEIFESKNDLIAILVSDLSDFDSTFITTSKNEANNEIKNKIYNQFLSDDTNEDFNLEIISKIISKSDKETITKIVDNVQNQSLSDTENNKSLKVLSAVATFNNNESVNLDDEKQTEVNRLIKDAIENIKENNEDTSLLANIITKSDLSVIEEVVDFIQDVEEANQQSGLSLKVLSSVATIQSEESLSLDSDEQTEVNRLIEQAVERAGDNDEDSSLLANIITKSDLSVIEEVVDLIQITEEGDDESNISLKVLSSIVEIQSEESLSLDSDEQTEVNRLIEQAVERAGDNDEDSSLLANIITKSDLSVIEEVVDLIQITEEGDDESNISLKVLSSIVEIQSEESLSLDSDEQTQVNRLIKEALIRNRDEEEDELLKGILDNTETEIEELIEEIINEEEAAAEEEAAEEEAAEEEAAEEEATEEEATEEEAAEEEAAEEEAAEEEAAEEEAAEEEAEEEYDANGFSFTSPFLHRDTGTEYNNEGFNSDGYNDEGFNENGDYNSVYDTNVSES
ncbi:FecR domain-containing protein [Candidatus Pelagibacter sp. Uisw_121]|uniref:FecR domain-containing protein n=1 Tax=Candidatus Pelagibacter sp. Uisw_121 TaxID=3230987 RepID=UPI0039ECF400